MLKASLDSLRRGGVGCGWLRHSILSLLLRGGGSGRVFHIHRFGGVGVIRVLINQELVEVGREVGSAFVLQVACEGVDLYRTACVHHPVIAGLLVGLDGSVLGIFRFLCSGLGLVGLLSKNSASVSGAASDVQDADSAQSACEDAYNTCSTACQ